MSWHTDLFSEQVFDAKYRGKAEDIKSLFWSLANLVSLQDKKLAKKFFQLMWEKRFSPGGRILAYAGKPGASLSLMNCTTHRVMGDSLEAISDTAYKIMRASSYGQGIGIDLSNLRPAGSPVNNAARTSTGSISFMEMLNVVGGTIGQEGRRGALLFSLRDSHPDLYRPNDRSVTCPSCGGSGCASCKDGYLPYDFLHVKKVPGKVENANISVMVSDAFIKAVKDDDMWELRFDGSTGGNRFTVLNVVPARELFDALAHSARTSAEPGILYWDTSKRMSNSDQFGERWGIVGVNACSETVLEQNGVCNLGSMNLAAYVVNPFTKNAYFDFSSFQNDVALAVEFLDNVVTVEASVGNHISTEQFESLLYLRRLGLGVMGLADMMAMLGLSYSGEKKTVDFLRLLFHTMSTYAYAASINLAQEKGPALVWNNASSRKSVVMDGGYMNTLPGHILAGIIEHGTRNVTVLSIAPTGTISNLFGVSSSIEPLFAREFKRRTRISGHDEFVDYVHPGVRLSRSLGLPDSVYQTAYEVSPDDHLAIQAVIQEYVDASISKTVNMPGGTTDNQVADLYMKAWELGLKGLSVFVDGSREEQVLYSQDEEACPECGSHLHREEGCVSCPTCGWAKCSL